MSEAAKESWGSGSAYELWVGRWSRLVAEEFIDWLAIPSGQIWGDVGCGTGALVECILGGSDPADVLGVDRSEAYVAEARNRVRDCASPLRGGRCMRSDVGLRNVRRHGVRSGAELRPGLRCHGERDGARHEARWEGRRLRLGLRGRDADDPAFLGCGSRAEPRRFETRPGRAFPALSAGPSRATLPTCRLDLGLGTRDRCPHCLSRLRGLLEAVLG